FKGDAVFVGVGNDPAVEPETDTGNQYGSYKIGYQHSPEAHSAAQNGNDLCLRSHFRSYKHDGNKNGDRCDQTCYIGDKINIVIDDLGSREIMFQKIIVLLRIVYHTNDGDQQKDDKEEGTQELLKYV